ncbi:MAG: CHAT domain-containing tetratricopeptide repeat protein [Bryobacterales bacterium]|nr:CHAT domain-containing protein [Bryobacteraceae bacterium]MDW8353122.1 CHAT domain-containing tetratricopeptide repeat protein [Bryobacterales bacterium]
MARWAVLWLLAVSLSCAHKPPGELQREALTLLRQGKRSDAWRLAEQGLREAGAAEDRWRLVLIQAEVLYRTGRSAEALKRLEQDAPPEDPETAVRRLTLLSRVLGDLGRRAESERALEEALRLAEDSGEPLLISLAEQLHGIVLQRRDATGAYRCLRRALDAAQRAAERHQEAATLVTLGWSRMSAGRHDEAIPWLEQALAIAVPAGYEPLVATATHNLGVCYNALGDWERAREKLQQAEKIYIATGDERSRAGLLGDLGNTYYFLREPQHATACYRRGLELARRLGDEAMAARWLTNLAMMAIEAGDPDAAEKFNQEAVELRARAGEADRLVWPLLNEARILTLRGRYSEAEARYREAIARAEKLDLPQALLEGRARLGRLYAQAGAYRLLAKEFDRLAADTARLRGRLSRLEWKFTFHASIVPFYQDYVDVLVRRGEIARAWEVVESCRARVLAERAASRHRSAAQSRRAEGARRVQHGGATVVLSYWLAPVRSFLFVRAKGSLAWFALPPEAEIRRLVEAYATALMAVEDPRDQRSPLGRKLYDVLVAPAREWIPRGANVLIVPDGALHELNFETLLTPDHPPRYWLEEVTLAVAPATSVLSPAPARTGRGLLVLGDPVPPAAQFPRLPDAAREIAGIAREFPVGPKKILTGYEAYPEAYRLNAPEQYALIHFAAHAEANRESPLDSAVILSRRGDGYKLYARDMLEQPLQANLVTISACRSAGTRTYSGEGLVGFAWVFLAAGARNVVAGLWNVNDRSTAQLISELYRRLGAGDSPAGALRAAKLALLAHPVYKRPYYWAPFQIFTRGGAFAPGAAHDDSPSPSPARIRKLSSR